MQFKNFFPYSTLQEINLDWILTKVKNILRFVPDDGTVGQILRRTKSGAEWSDEQGGGGGAVSSVNGQTGDVVLDASDVGALPDTYVAPVTSVNNKTGAVTITKSDVGLSNVANVAQYSASNPPPYPVTSVNGQTGDVVISGGGAVDSVNGKTGDVVLDASDVGALPDSTTIPTKTSDLNNDSGFITSAQAPVQSVNGQTGNVTVQTIKIVEIPQSVFSWNGGTSSFYCANVYSAVPALTSTPLGFFVFFTNGSAISGTRLQSNSLYVMGWIPNGATSISSSYTFNCYAILAE